jgi:hypothetical protein
LVQHTIQSRKNIPNEKNIAFGHKIYQMAINIPNGYIIIQHFPPHGPPKYTQIGILWSKNVRSGNPGAELFSLHLDKAL